MCKQRAAYFHTTGRYPYIVDRYLAAFFDPIKVNESWKNPVVFLFDDELLLKYIIERKE